ncbi:MAG TPA: hypothetical protein VHG34_05060 [Nitrososphaeraceae archaeon]|nr:hypothetical protein [Nitrososphaeraceae archaeon]
MCSRALAWLGLCNDDILYPNIGLLFSILKVIVRLKLGTSINALVQPLS